MELIKQYHYIARGSKHKNHIVELIKWNKGKSKFYCQDCSEYFIGITRTLRKIK